MVTVLNHLETFSDSKNLQRASRASSAHWKECGKAVCAMCAPLYEGIRKNYIESSNDSKEESSSLSGLQDHF